jgi:hypothetical protein
MKTVNAAIVPNSWVSLELRDRWSRQSLNVANMKRDERRKSRRVLNAELAARSLGDIREDFKLLEMPAPKARTFLDLPIPLFLQVPEFPLDNVPKPTRFNEVKVVRKRISHRRASVETLLIPAGW